MFDFADSLIGWYETHKRDLPWRKTTDPYPIWLSEVILQQTRVEQGRAYYERFLETFPTVKDLAEAEEGQVLKLWQGLGYYSRARNLHRAAQMVMTDFNGRFPQTYLELKKLKGVGDYTAAAIASFCFQEPTPVLDGNVYRVLSRYAALNLPINKPQAKKVFTAHLEKLIDPKRPDLFNQALMELGALVCKPKQPTCQKCPLQPKCKAYHTGTIAQFPVKNKKVKIRKRYFNYLFVEGDKHLIQKRKEKDIWQNLYEFPLVETDRAISKRNRKKLPQAFQKAIPSKTYKHVLSHQHLYAIFWIAKGVENEKDFKEAFWVDSPKLNTFAFPRLITRFLEDLQSPELKLELH